MTYLGTRNQISANETGNSTQVLLGISATYTGVWEDVTNYTTGAVTILGTLATATGTLYMDLSTNGGTTFTTLPFPIADITFNLPHVINIIETHFRMRYVNDAIAQTGTFSIQTKYSNGQPMGLNHVMGDNLSDTVEGQVVKSVLAGRDIDGAYKNVHLTRGGRLGVTITDADSGFHAIVTPGGGLKVNEKTHLVGEAFGTVTLNTAKWNIDLVGSGSQDATGNGELTMDTGVTANSAVEIDSIDIARFIPANYNTTHHAITIPDGASYVANNIRKWGAFNATSPTCNGAYFELDSGVRYVAHCLAGTPTRVVQGSWNGAAAISFPTNSITANVYEIEYNAGSIIYRANGNVIHRENLLTSPYANTINFPVGMSNTNTGGSIIDVSMKVRAAAIYTLGKGSGVDRPYYIAGTTAGVVVKTGPGHLSKLIIARNGAGGGDVTVSIYDAVSATNQIARIAIDTDITSFVDYDITFNIGLYIVITGLGTLGTTITFD